MDLFTDYTAVNDDIDYLSLLADDIDPSMDYLDVIDRIPIFKRRYNLCLSLLRKGYDFKNEQQPEAWIQRLIYIPNSNPRNVCTFIVKAFGINGECKELSTLYGYPITVLEAVSQFRAVDGPSNKTIGLTLTLLIQLSVSKR